jgi:hypothetical protein
VRQQLVAAVGMQQAHRGQGSQVVIPLDALGELLRAPEFAAQVWSPWDAILVALMCTFRAARATPC